MKAQLRYNKTLVFPIMVLWDYLDDKMPQQIIKHTNDPITVEAPRLGGHFTASVSWIVSARRFVFHHCDSSRFLWCSGFLM